LEEGTKMQYKQMWTIPEVFICENKFHVSDSSTGPTPRRGHAKVADVVTPAGPWTTFGRHSRW